LLWLHHSFDTGRHSRAGNSDKISEGDEMDIRVQELIDYTNWERGLWRSWFGAKGKAPLAVSTQGERLKNVADLIQHVFAVELRYIQRLKGEPLTPYSNIPKDSAEDLFEFGDESRLALQEYVSEIPDWNKLFQLNIGNFQVRTSLRKLIIHIQMHEIRHWAQVALLLRSSGYHDLGAHDFLDSDAII
jgi:uncharacterized damage-inducible protein DinB